MMIKDVHMNSPIELRFTIVDGDRETVCYTFPMPDHSAEQIAGQMANAINLYSENKANGFPHDYNEAKHVAGILADAGRYGTD